MVKPIQMLLSINSLRIIMLNYLLLMRLYPLELENLYLDADYIIFPYIDMSQSGPMRFSRELGSFI